MLARPQPPFPRKKLKRTPFGKEGLGTGTQFRDDQRLRELVLARRRRPAIVVLRSQLMGSMCQCVAQFTAIGK
jgi:hypothetical protein